MAMTENSSGFCLFCYKSTEIPLVATDGLLESTKNLAKVLNRGTSDQNVRIDEDQLLTGFSENYKLLNYCSSCDTIITQLCEMYNQIKRLELQLDLKLDKLVEKISFPNKVPSRWVHMTKALEEHFQDDTGNNTATGQNVIREFRQNVLKAAQHRKQNSQPNLQSQKIHLKRQHGHGKGMDNKSNGKDRKQILEDDSDDLVDTTTISGHSDKNNGNHWSPDHNLEKAMPINAEADRECIEEVEHNAAFIPVKIEHAAVVDGMDQDEYLTQENFNTTTVQSPKVVDSGGTLRMENENIVIKEERTILFSNFEQTDMMDSEDNCETEHWWDNTSTISSTLSISDKVLPPFIEEPKRRPPPLPRQSTSASSSNLAYECEICPSKFKHFSLKERHFKLCHDLEGKAEADTFKCKIGDCKAYFLNTDQLRRHYNFDHQSSLPLQSSVESKRKAGRRRQPPPKQMTFSFKCEICTRQFKVRGQKDHHVKACHGLPGSSEATEVFKCEMGDCTAYFLKKYQLHKHYDVEHKDSAQVEPSDESNKEYECNRCGKVFIGWLKFTKHCNKFRFKSCANFECKFCGEKFPYVVMLNKHLSDKHKNEMEGKDGVRGNKNVEKVIQAVENAEEKETCVDGKGDMDNDKTSEVNLVDEKRMNFESNVFGRKGVCLESGNLVEIEDLD